MWGTILYTDPESKIEAQSWSRPSTYINLISTDEFVRSLRIEGLSEKPVLHTVEGNAVAPAKDLKILGFLQGLFRR